MWDDVASESAADTGFGDAAPSSGLIDGPEASSTDGADTLMGSDTSDVDAMDTDPELGAADTEVDEGIDL